MEKVLHDLPSAIRRQFPPHKATRPCDKEDQQHNEGYGVLPLSPQPPPAELLRYADQQCAESDSRDAATASDNHRHDSKQCGGSGTVFGPYDNPTNIKYVQAPGAEPTEKPGSGAVDYNLKGTGDAQVYAVDGSGNISDRVECLVPPPPK